MTGPGVLKFESFTARPDLASKCMGRLVCLMLTDLYNYASVLVLCPEPSVVMFLLCHAL